MSARIIDGRALARTLRAQIARDATALAARGVTPGLRVVLAGDDPASAIYVRLKARMAAKVGIDAETLRLPATVTAAELLAVITRLNGDPAVHGILVQLPLPPSISAAEAATILQAVDPRKDVDGLHPQNLGALLAGTPSFVACTPSGVMRMLRAADVPLAGKRAVVLGRSTIVGKPMSQLLLAADATVTTCHSRTRDTAAIVREADVVIAAVGRPGLVRGDWIKPGAAVIDVGVNRLPDGSLCGDVAFDEVREVAGHLSPVPGGVGPMTVASLLQNVCRAAEQRLGEGAAR